MYHNLPRQPLVTMGRTSANGSRAKSANASASSKPKPVKGVKKDLDNKKDANATATAKASAKAAAKTAGSKSGKSGKSKPQSPSPPAAEEKAVMSRLEAFFASRPTTPTMTTPPEVPPQVPGPEQLQSSKALPEAVPVPGPVPVPASQLLNNETNENEGKKEPAETVASEDVDMGNGDSHIAQTQTPVKILKKTEPDCEVSQAATPEIPPSQPRHFPNVPTPSPRKAMEIEPQPLDLLDAGIFKVEVDMQTTPARSTPPHSPKQSPAPPPLPRSVVMPRTPADGWRMANTGAVDLRMEDRAMVLKLPEIKYGPIPSSSFLELDELEDLTTSWRLPEGWCPPREVERPVVWSLESMMKWPEHYAGVSQRVMPTGVLNYLRHALRRRNYRTMFSGVDAPGAPGRARKA